MTWRDRLRTLRMDTTPLRSSRDFRLLFVAGTVFYFGAAGHVQPHPQGLEVGSDGGQVHDLVDRPCGVQRVAGVSPRDRLRRGGDASAQPAV